MENEQEMEEILGKITSKEEFETFISFLKENFTLTDFSEIEHVLEGLPFYSYHCKCEWEEECSYGSVSLQKLEITGGTSMSNDSVTHYKFFWCWVTGSNHMVSMEGDLNGKDLTPSLKVTIGIDESTVFYPTIKIFFEKTKNN